MNYINSVTINGGNRTIGLGTKVYLTATILPSNATYPVVHWCSSNPSVVEVDKYTGCVYANSMGSVVITAQAQDGSYKQGTCIVTACAIPVESVSVLPTTLKLKVGEKAPLEAVVSPSNATNKTVRWYSNSGSDMPVVDVNATTGCVYAKSLGVAKVFAVSKDGTNKTDSCDVEVVETLPQWVTITPYGGSIYKGGEMDLSASVYPADTTYKQVRWSTEDNNIIELDPNTGHIVAKAVGTATVKAYVMVTPSVFTTCKIEVTPYVPVMDIQLCPDKMTLFVGQTTTLDPLIYPSDASEQSVKWSSWDSTIASVDQSGVITAKKGGTTTITVEGEKGKKASVEVNVYIDTVTIEPDGDHKLNTKVVFCSTGKVWYCINRDMIYDERNMGDMSLHRRCNRNVFVDPDKSNDLKEFTDDEIKLLYAIDPCGVARYVQDYAQQKYQDLKDVVTYKNAVFRRLFGRDPLLFDRDANGEWFITIEELNPVEMISESELIFGSHVLWDEVIWVNCLEVLCELVKIGIEHLLDYLGNFEVVSDLIQTVLDVVKCFILYAAGVEEVLEEEKGAIINDIINIFTVSDDLPIQDVMETMEMYESVYIALKNISEHMSSRPKYFNQIIKWYAFDLNYDIIVKTGNGELYTMREVYTAMA